MKHRRSNYFIITLLMCLSLVSVGFASWNVSRGVVTDTANPSVVTDIVVNSSDYVYLDTTKGTDGITCFNYKNTGYLNSSGVVVDTGYIDTYYIINQKKCAEIFSGFNSVKLTIKLQYDSSTPSSTNIFASHNDSNGYRSISHNITTALGYTSNKIDTTEVCYKIEIIFTNIISNYSSSTSSETVTFTLRYALFATTGDYFKNNIYPCLYSDNVTFKTIVTISGINV